MEKAKVKQIGLIAMVSLVVIVVYNYGMKEYNKSKTAAPKTTA